MTDRTTHFGYRQVPEGEKTGLVGQVFNSVADKYDLMNDLMSAGAHRLWKRFAIAQSGVRYGHRVLDVAAGSGDLSLQFAQKVGDDGALVVTDINAAMLQRGRDRLIDSGFVNIQFVQADAENLPFATGYFDRISIAFGLRNVTRQQAALDSMCRCLRPGGRLLILEFSRPADRLLRTLYDAYSFNVIPRIGRVVTGDEDSYQYLVESIRKHPSQPELKRMMCNAGFERVHYHNLAGGIVALHIGHKL